MTNIYDEGKTGVAVFVFPCLQPYFFLTVGNICGAHGERSMRLSALLGMAALGKPQHRGIMGNHRRKPTEVNPIICETQAVVTAALTHTHSSHTAAWSLHMNPNNNCLSA